MPVCAECDSKKFYDQDGKFYCEECGTESQDVLVEVSQQVDVISYNNLEQKKLEVSAKTKKTGKKRKPHNVGKAWVIYEGFQLLIKAQVEALVYMGYDQRLKEVVGQLWFYYLQHHGIAFCEKEPAEITLHSQEMGRPKNVGILPPSIKKRRGLLLKEECNEDECELTIDKEEFYEDDLPEEAPKVNEKVADVIKLLMNQGENESESDSSDEFVADVDDVRLLRKKRLHGEASQAEEGCVGSYVPDTHTKAVKSTLKQQLTLALCYIGLVYLEEPILLSELIRWSQEGHLPYHKANEIFPKEMKFSDNDFRSFNTKLCPDIKKLTKFVVKLVKSLDVDVKYSSDMLKIITTSVVMDMQLPDAISKLTFILMDRIKFTFSFLEIKSHFSSHYTLEGCICAFISIAMKCVYYLDGQHEYADHSNTYILEQLSIPSIPSWKEWVVEHMRRMKSRLKNGIPLNESEMFYVDDLRTYTDYLQKDVFKSFNQRVAKGTFRQEYSWYKGYDSSAKEHYHKMFEPVAKHHNPQLKDDEVTRKNNSFPFTYNELGESSSFGTVKDIIIDETINSTTHKPVSDLEEENTLKLENYKRVCGSVKCTDCSVNLNSTESFTYMIYERYKNINDVHHSLRYFLSTIATRFELRDTDVYSYILELEGRLFDKELNILYSDLLT